MYTPGHFAQSSPEAVVGLIEAHPLGALTTMLDGRLEATHVPVVVDREGNGVGALRFHLAAANPLCAALEDAAEVLMVFTGPEAYVSPDWYDTAQLVPTWNYVAVHAYGRPNRLDDDGLCALVDDLSARNEVRLLPKPPWTTDKVPAARYQRMRTAIVGFRMPVLEVQGKWKLSQNRTAADRAGVASALEQLDGENNRAIALAMRRSGAGA